MIEYFFISISSGSPSNYADRQFVWNFGIGKKTNLLNPDQVPAPGKIFPPSHQEEPSFSMEEEPAFLHHI